MFDFLLRPEMAPVWAALGAGLVKFLDYLTGRFNKREDSSVAHMGKINEATQQLINGLFSQIKTLQETTSDLQRQLRETHSELDAKIERVLQLEAEVVILRRDLIRDLDKRSRAKSTQASS